MNMIFKETFFQGVGSDSASIDADTHINLELLERNCMQ